MRDLPLVISGDLHDTKGLIRAECANTMIATMKYAEDCGVPVYILVGNHDLIHEKSSEHALEFLSPYAMIIDRPQVIGSLHFIPYQNTAAKFLAEINKFKKGSIVIAHQGTIGGQLGDYVKDSSAFDPAAVKDYKVFLGHYHAHYELGTTVSIGNPYTLTFGEAKDPEKGFLVVHEDGTYDRILTHQRRHWVVAVDFKDLEDLDFSASRSDDLMWFKVTGRRSELDSLDKIALGNRLFGHTNFKLDKTCVDAVTVEQQKDDNKTAEELMDAVIDNTSESGDTKEELKHLWRELI